MYDKYNPNIDYYKNFDTEVDYEELLYKRRYELESMASIAHMGCIVTSSPSKNIIGTTALDTCYGIVFYDRKNKWGMVGHGAPSTKIQTLARMISRLGDEKRDIEIAIVSGYRNIERHDSRGEEELYEYIRRYCPSNIKFIPFQGDLGIRVCDKVLAYEFAFDVNTGLSVSSEIFYEGNISFKKI